MTDALSLISERLRAPGRPSSDYDLNPDIVLPDNRKLREAAVLIPIVEHLGDLHVILTMRSSALKHHPGQIAFPGGKVEPSDASTLAAALREADEEIGLPSDQVEILGTLPSHETVTGFTVTPVVGAVHGDFDAFPQPGEVEEVFYVPLAHLQNADSFAIQSRRWRGLTRQYYTVPFGPYYIWGATARMLRAFADQVAG